MWTKYLVFMNAVLLHTVPCFQDVMVVQMMSFSLMRDTHVYTCMHVNIDDVIVRVIRPNQWAKEELRPLWNMSLQCRNNERDGVSNHKPHDRFLKRLFRRTSKKTSKLRVIGLCEENSPVTGEFPAQRTSNAENDSIWWCHHGIEYRKNSKYQESV